MPDLFSFRANTFAGIRVGQAWVDLFAWESILNQMEKQTPPLARIIELGTACGGLTWFFSVQAFARSGGIEVHTYDLCVGGKYDIHKTTRQWPGVYLHLGDMWDSIDDIRALIARPGGTALLCDGGDKPRELNTFCDSLKSGDLLAAHDWMMEIKPEHLPSGFADRFDECSPLGDLIEKKIIPHTLTAFWRCK